MNDDEKEEWVWLQALVVSYEDSFTTPLSQWECYKEFDALLPADVLVGNDATKESVIDRITKGSASLVHFLAHGTPGGKRLATVEEVGEKIASTASIEFTIFRFLCVQVLS